MDNEWGDYISDLTGSEPKDISDVAKMLGPEEAAKRFNRVVKRKMNPDPSGNGDSAVHAEEPNPFSEGAKVNLTGPNAKAEERVIWDTSTTNHKSAPQKCIFPEDSILSDYMDLARQQCESADCFLIGSVLPVCSALLARRVRFPWGSTVWFPNLFSMITGKAGDRKSSAINFARDVGKGCLPPEAFLSKRVSPETLFDEFDTQKGGLPDKLYVVDDAKSTLTDWKKMANGERVAACFLELYDCPELTENLRRNAQKNQPKTRRRIPQTSTSLIFGATFGDASFPGQAVQSGMARRFLYYVAEGMGREIAFAQGFDIAPLVDLFSRLKGFQGVCGFTEEAKKLWIDFQHENRLRIAGNDPRRESEGNRLASAPKQTLAIAIDFEACICAKQMRTGFDKISKQSLSLAIEHVDACLEAAVFLDSIANRESTSNDAEILLAKIRKDFSGLSKNGSILLTRSQITATYAPHSARRGSWNPDLIFLKLIPTLTREGSAKLFDKTGKRETYAFRND